MDQNFPFRSSLIEGRDSADCVLDRGAPPVCAIGNPPRDMQALHDPGFVNRWLQRILGRVHEPVEVQWFDGDRLVQVLGQIVLRFARDGTITPYLWEVADEPVCTEVDPHQVNLAGMPYGWLWLDRFRDAFELELAYRLGRHDLRSAAYAAWVFERIRARLRRGEDVARMRRRVADALALDAEALAIARRIEWGPRPNISVRASTYNEVVSHRLDYDKLTRECPGLVALYAALREAIPPGGEPAARLRRHLIGIGISPATWRVVHHGNGRLLRLLPEFYSWPGADATEDLLRIVDMLAPSTQPPIWFVRTLLHQFGNFDQRLDGYYDALRRVSIPLRRLMALTERAGSDGTAAIRDNLYGVVSWLVADEQAAAHPYARRATWAWFRRNADAWHEREQRRAQCDATRWPVPFERIEVDGLSVVALQTPLVLWEEGRAMRHCAGRLESVCAKGTTLLFSIRRDGRARPVATMRAHYRDDRWLLRQVAACANTIAPPSAQRVAQRVVDLLNAQGWTPARRRRTSALAPTRAEADHDGAADRAPPTRNANMTSRTMAATNLEARARFARWSRPKRVGCPRTRPASARFVARVELFSETPMNQRTDVYWLSTNRARSHWFLWSSYFDDEFEQCWVHQVYAYMPRRGVDARSAAITLLTCGWRAERDGDVLAHRPACVEATGLLTAADIDAIAQSVWPQRNEEDNA